MGNLKYYIARRIITFLPTLIGLTILTFFISMVIPSNPARLWAGGVKASPEVIAALKKRYHLDEPLHVRYYYYIVSLFHGDLGVSPITHRPIIEDLATYFPATFELALVSEFLIIVIGVPLGIISAFKRNSVVDHVVRIFALAGVSMPVFWFGLLLQWVFYYYLGWFPGSSRGIRPAMVITNMYLIDSIICGDWNAFIDNLKHIILPAFTLSFISIGVIARITRSSVIEVMGSDFVEFLKVKGVVKKYMIKHIIKNSLVPVITVLGLQFGGLLGGAVITETIFAWPGIGRYAVQGVESLDFPAIMGVTVLIGLIYVIVNFLVDILYAVIDPRVRL